MYIKKLKGFARRTWKNFQSDSHFSMKYAFLRVVDEAGGRLKLKTLSQRAHNLKDRWILEYLLKELESIIYKYKEDCKKGEYVKDAPIWICWWTGIDTAPKLVKKCIESTYKNAGEHRVHLITKDNYQEYIQIPEFIQRRVDDGKMGLAHLADYIRVKLLATYGGLWLDATIFCSQQIPDMCFDVSLFTCKGPVRKSKYISDYRWVTFCLGGWKGNVFYRFLVDAFEQYWSRNAYAVDYLFFDYIILLAYTQLPAVKQLLDELPDNNIHRDDLQAAMNASLPAKKFEEVIQMDTALYKLSWRESYSVLTCEGHESIYAYFLKNHI